MNIINFIRDLFHQPYFVCLLAIITCTCYYYLESEKTKRRKIVWFFYSSIFAGTLVIFFASAIYRIYHPEIWDFTAFYLYGKVAALGYNFYSPENFQTVFNSLQLPFSGLGGFKQAVLNVGFPYPPPTILYFVSLGYFSYKTALIIWTTFNLVILSGCIYLFHNLFFKDKKLNGLFLISILVFIFLPCLSTINFSQTNFILLFLLLLTYKYSDRKFSGLFLAMAFFTKPYMIIFGFFFLLRMKWKTIVYCMISALVFAGITFAIFGKEPFTSYLFNNPSQRLPAYVFSESVNQSLHAVLLRNNIISLDSSSTFLYIVAGLFLLTTGYLIYLVRRKLYDYIWAVLLLVGLLVYPGTLSHYAVLLLFIIFQFFDNKRQLGFNPYLTVAITGILFYLCTTSVFTAICFLLAIVVLKSIRHMLKENQFTNAVPGENY